MALSPGQGGGCLGLCLVLVALGDARVFLQEKAPHQSTLIAAISIPMIVAAVMTFVAFLVIVMACMLLKLRFSCPCMRGEYEALEGAGVVEPVDGEDGGRLDRGAGRLPTYEEAVYGHVGTSPPFGAQGPCPLFSESDFSRPEPRSPCLAPGGSPFSEEPPSYHEALATAFAEAHGLLSQELLARQAKRARRGEANAP